MKTTSSVKLAPIDTRTPSPEPGATQGARRATGEAPGSGGTQPSAIVPPDPEVDEKKPRRRFTAKYKLRILKDADRCSRKGQLGALLRRDFIHPT